MSNVLIIVLVTKLKKLVFIKTFRLLLFDNWILELVKKVILLD